MYQSGLPTINIYDEFGVIAVRQEARTITHQARFDLGQQAKTTAAISGLVRALLDCRMTAKVQMRLTQQHHLEVLCWVDHSGRAVTDIQLWQILSQAKIAPLTDLLEVVHEMGRPYVRLTITPKTHVFSAQPQNQRAYH